RRLGNLLLLPVSLESGPSLGRAIGLLQEATPAVRRSHADAPLLDEPAILLPGLLIALLLFRRQIDKALFHLVLRQVIRGELPDLLAIDDGPDQFRQHHVLAVGALGRGSQPKPIR